MLIEYPKIETVYKRDENGSRKLLEGQWRNETVEYLAPLNWHCTEKVDGTNIRIHWDGHTVSIYGRTGRANLPVHLLSHLYKTFLNNEAEELFEQSFGETECILFGEGYGPKIQTGGGLYRDDPSFILFDAYVNGLWLRRNSLDGLAKTFGIDVVPTVGILSLYDAIAYVKEHPKSLLSEKHDMEGLVCRPMHELLDRRGNRLIVKIKAKDFT